LTVFGKSKNRSTSIRTLAYESLVIFAVGALQWIVFLIILVSFKRQIGVQQLRGKLGNRYNLFFFIKYKKLYRSKSETKLETNRSDIHACTYKQAKGTGSLDQINATK
jgi:hypothetical protein